MTVASSQINSQSKHDLICHALKGKALPMTQSLDVLGLKYFIFLPISELASLKELDNSVLLSKT